MPDSGSKVLSVNVTVTSSGFCGCGCGDDERVESTGFDLCFSAYFWRFLILEDVGLRTVYFDVIRVWMGLALVDVGSKSIAYRGWSRLEQ